MAGSKAERMRCQLKPCEMCSWPQASYQPGQIALLPQLPLLEKGKISPPGHCHTDGAPSWFIHHWSHTCRYLHTHKQACMHPHPHNTGTVLAQTRTVALCPIEFAGPVAEHNKVFTLRHFSERESGGGGQYEGSQWVWHREGEGKRKGTQW